MPGPNDEKPAEILPGGGEQAPQVQPSINASVGLPDAQPNVSSTSPPATSAPSAPAVEPDNQGQKRPREDAESIIAAAVQRSYRYDLGPGDEIESAISNLRRRVETECRDGLQVTISLHIVRNPDAGIPPAAVTAEAPVTAPARPQGRVVAPPN